MINLFKREPGLIVLIVIPLLFFAPELFGQSRFAGVDHTKLNMPMKRFDVQALDQGEIPLWNPYIATGAPHIAEGESGWFYILNVIDHFHGEFYYWYGLNIILHFMIAGTTCYFLLRYKGAGLFGATVFSVLYQFAPFFMLHLAAVAMFQLLAWVPLLILLFEKVFDGVKPSLNILWGIFLVFQMHCIGSPQMLFFSYSAIFVLWILKSFIKTVHGGMKRGIGFILITSVAGSILAAVQLLPTTAFTELSIRGNELPEVFHADGTWLDWNRLATIFLFPASNFSNLEDAIGFGSSQVYIGPLAFLMVLLAFMNKGIRQKTLPYLILLIPLLLFSFGYNFIVYRFLTGFPPFSMFRFLGRYSILFVLFSLIPASIAFEGILKEPAIWAPKLRKAFTVAAVCMAVLLALFFATGQGTDFSGYLLIGINLLLVVGIVFFVSTDVKKIKTVASILILVQLIALYPFARMMSLSKEGFETSISILDDIKQNESVLLKRMMIGYAPWVVDPHSLLNRDYKSRDWLIDSSTGLCSMMDGIGVFYIYLPLRELKWEEVLGGRLLMDLLDNPNDMEHQSENICWILGINYIVVEFADTIDLPGYVPYGKDELVGVSFRPTAKMFVREEPYERFFLTRNVRSYKFLSEGESQSGLWQFLNRILPEESDKDEYGVVLSADQDPPLFADTKDYIDGEIEVMHSGFNSVELRVDCMRDCYLVARENYYPGWRVEVNGKPATMYKADYVNRAVYLTSGEHTIEFIYEPPEFYLGMKISIISGILFILGCIFVWRRSKLKASA